MSHLVKKEDLQDYIQALAVKKGCPVYHVDKTKAHWDLIMHRTACMVTECIKETSCLAVHSVV